MKRIATPAKCAPREMMRHIEFYNHPYSTFKLILVAGDERELVHLDPAFACSSSEYFAIGFAPGSKWAAETELHLDEIAPDAPKSVIAVASMLFRTFYAPQAMELNDRARAWSDAIILLHLCNMLQVSDEIKKLAVECIRGIMRAKRDRDCNKAYLADLVGFIGTEVWDECVEPLLRVIYKIVKYSESAALRGNEADRRSLITSTMDAIPDELRSHYLIYIVKGAGAMSTTAASVMISDVKDLQGDPLITYLSHLNALRDVRVFGAIGQERMRAWCDALDSIDRGHPGRAKFVEDFGAMMLNTILHRGAREARVAPKRKRSVDIEAQYFEEVDEDEEEGEGFDPISDSSSDEAI